MWMLHSNHSVCMIVTQIDNDLGIHSFYKKKKEKYWISLLHQCFVRVNFVSRTELDSRFLNSDWIISFDSVPIILVFIRKKYYEAVVFVVLLWQRIGSWMWKYQDLLRCMIWIPVSVLGYLGYGFFKLL